jgi:hypothetical protein
MPPPEKGVVAQEFQPGAAFPQGHLAEPEVAPVLPVMFHYSGHRQGVEVNGMGAEMPAKEVMGPAHMEAVGHQAHFLQAQVLD